MYHALNIELIDVKNIQKPKPKYRPAFRQQDLGMLYRICPLSRQSTITLFFQVPVIGFIQLLDSNIYSNLMIR